MKILLLALQFLTILPIRIKNVTPDEIGRSMIFFPVAGYLIGLLASGIFIFLGSLEIPDLAASVIIIVSMTLITGGIHLDGLSDTADAFLSRKPKDSMLAIMRDSHAGVMGNLTVICVLLLKIAFLFSVQGYFKISALLLACTISRWGQVFQISLFPYARTEGKGKVYSDQKNRGIFIVASAITFFVSWAIFHSNGILLMGGAGLTAYLTGTVCARKIGGVTGDTLGASSEILEVMVLFFMVLAG